MRKVFPRLVRGDSLANLTAVQDSLHLGAAAQHAFETAESSGVASESTCWAEAADAVLLEVTPEVAELHKEVTDLRGTLAKALPFLQTALRNHLRHCDDLELGSDGSHREIVREVEQALQRAASELP